MAHSAPPSGQLTRPEEITMNRKIALVLLLACTGAVAYADDITMDPVPFTSALTRAQVMQDLRQYRQAGVNPWADDYNQLAQFRSSLSREQVLAEFMLTRDSVAALGGEDSGSMYMARRETTVKGGTHLAAAPAAQ
jgi:hypothetical protein